MCAHPAHAWSGRPRDSTAAPRELAVFDRLNDDEPLNLVQAAALVSLICSGTRVRDALMAHLLGHRTLARELLTEAEVSTAWVTSPVEAEDLQRAEYVLASLAGVAAADASAAGQIAAMRALVQWVAQRPVAALGLLDRAPSSGLGRSVRALVAAGVPGPGVLPSS